MILNLKELGHIENYPNTNKAKNPITSWNISKSGKNFFFFQTLSWQVIE